MCMRNSYSNQTIKTIIWTELKQKQKSFLCEPITITRRYYRRISNFNFSGINNFYLPIKPTVAKRYGNQSIGRMKTPKCNLLDSGRRLQTECGRWRIDCFAKHRIHNSSLKICCRFSFVTHDLTLCVQFELWSLKYKSISSDLSRRVCLCVCVDFSVTWNEVHTQILSTHCHHWHHEVLRSDEHTSMSLKCRSLMCRSRFSQLQTLNRVPKIVCFCYLFSSKKILQNQRRRHQHQKVETVDIYEN